MHEYAQMSNEHAQFLKTFQNLQRTHLPFAYLTDRVHTEDIQAEQIANGRSKIKINVGTGVHDVSAVLVHLSRG